MDGDVNTSSPCIYRIAEADENVPAKRHKRNGEGTRTMIKESYITKNGGGFKGDGGISGIFEIYMINRDARKCR